MSILVNTTRAELIAEVRNILRESTADSTITDKFIWSVIDKHIRWLIKRQGNNLKLMDYDSFFQTIKGVKVEEAPRIDDCLGVKSKCTVYRTVEKLPDIYEDDSGVIIKSVFTIDGTMDFSYTKVNEYMRKLASPEVKYDRSRYFFYNNGYLYFPNSRIDMVMVKAMFVDNIENECSDCPHSVSNCLSAQENLVWIPDNIRGELMDYVKKDLGLMKQIPPDEQINKNEQRK